MTSTASPARLLIMLYDRLVLDLQRAVELGDLGEFLGAGRQLMHAQEIVLELQGSLQASTPGTARPQLSGIYAWLHSELVRANVAARRRGDPGLPRPRPAPRRRLARGGAGRARRLTSRRLTRLTMTDQASWDTAWVAALDDLELTLE